MGCKLGKMISGDETNNSSCDVDQIKDTVDDNSTHNCVKTEEPQLELAPTLDKQQKTLILNTWKLLVDNVSKVGVITFMGLFETHPDVQNLFVTFRGMGPEELKYSKELRAHALRVMGFVQKVVARINEPQKCEQLLWDLGRKHVNYGAKKQYIDLVGPQFIYAIKPSLEAQWTDDIEMAWNQLFIFMGFHIKIGMSSVMSSAISPLTRRTSLLTTEKDNFPASVSTEEQMNSE